jgi:plasmid maintenance system antidote protein VapI
MSKLPKKHNRKRFNNNLAIMRYIFGFRLDEIGTHLGLTKSHLSSIETKQQKLSFDMASRLSDLFGISILSFRRFVNLDLKKFIKNLDKQDIKNIKIDENNSNHSVTKIDFDKIECGACHGAWFVYTSTFFINNEIICTYCGHKSKAGE